MPSTYAHRRFGADVLALLPDGLRATLEQHRELYDIGLHGPDLMFYYKALQSNPVNRLGNAMHEQKGEVFFTRARTVVENATDKSAALAYADAPRPQHKTEADHEGYAAADVSPRIAPAGHFVHPLGSGHVAEHRIVEHQTARKAHFRNDEDDQKRQPRRRRAHGAAAHDAHENAEYEDRLLEALRISHCPQNGAQNSRDDGHSRAGIAPVSQILH